MVIGHDGTLAPFYIKWYTYYIIAKDDFQYKIIDCIFNDV